jgi:hypothetical protein
MELLIAVEQLSRFSQDITMLEILAMIENRIKFPREPK